MSEQTFRLPDLGEGLTEAEVVRWLVQEGDTVEVDQPVVEVETAKSLVEVPTPYAGRITTRHAGEGVTLEVGQPLLTVTATVAATVAAETYREEERAGSGNVLIGYGTSGGPVTTRHRRPRTTARPAAAPAPHRVPLVVSPLVRKLARDGGLDLAAVAPTGPGGVIVRADVERALARPATHARPPAGAGPSPISAPASISASAFASAPAPASASASASVLAPAFSTAPASATALASAAVPAPAAVVPGERRIPFTGFRKAAAAALTRSRAEIPEATVWVDVDATNLWDLRQATTPGPGLLAYLARFVVAGLREYPVLNARVDTERQEIVEYDRIDLGLAVQGDRGLVVPAVAGAGTMTTAQLDTEIRRVTAAAREGRVTAPDTGTFTLNNYGGFRVDGSAAIINHPQVAILGFGRILDRPWVVGGEIRIRKITQMSFVFDHRVCDGGTAAGFMRSVADAIEDPASAIARL